MVLLGIEIALFVMGITAIAKGEASLGKGKKITGTRARVWGAMMMMPIPLAFLGGFTLGILSVTQQNDALLNYAPLCDVIAIFVSCIAATVVGGKGDTETGPTPVATLVAE